MRKPITTTTKSLPDESGGKFYYIETDYVLENLRKSLQGKHGMRPHVYYKYVSTSGNPGSFSRDSASNLYLLHRAYGGGTFSVELVGPESSLSDFCGIEFPARTPTPATATQGSTRSTSTTASSPSTIRNSQTGFRAAVPATSRAGVVSMAYTTRQGGSPGFQLVGTTDGVGFAVSSIQYDFSASRTEILDAWNTYVAAKEAKTPEDALAKKRLRYKNKFGKEGTIDTFRELQEAFPSWFLINGNFLSESLSEIAGGKLAIVNSQVYPASYVGLWQRYSADGLSEKQVVETLREKGYTESQINATRLASGLSAFDSRKFRYGSFSGEALNLAPLINGGDPNKPGSDGATGGAPNGVSGGAKSRNGNPWLGPEGYKVGGIQQITVGRSRNIFLTSDQVQSIVSYDNQKPIMYQVYIKSTGPDGVSDVTTVPYEFDFAPNDINYSGFGGEWTSIERSGSFPIIDWKSFKLLQISFSFIIANKNGELTADGLDLPVTRQIETLQSMAQAPYPVMFYGFDTLLTNQFRYDSSGKARGVQFVIQDLNITSQRRNKNMEITRAQATITLQEIPIETTAIIGMPRLRHKAETPKPPPPPVTDPGYGLATRTLTVQQSNQMTNPSS